MSVPKPLLRGMDTRDGHRCAWHDEGHCDPATLVPHHRSNRGMGGSRSKNRLSNLVWLCALMNGLIESDPAHAEYARKRGIKISSHAEPSHEPIQHAVLGRVLLNDDGTYEKGVVVF